jgi:uncharacterized protein
MGAYYRAIVFAIVAVSLSMFSGIAQAGSTPLHEAVRNINKKLAESLIAKGANINARDEDGFVPLLISPNKEMVELLIARGADMNIRDYRGRTPLRHFTEVNATNLVDLLKKRGAKGQ